jgi:hypothetical protein
VMRRFTVQRARSRPRLGGERARDLLDCPFKFSRSASCASKKADDEEMDEATGPPVHEVFKVLQTVGATDARRVTPTTRGRPGALEGRGRKPGADGYEAASSGHGCSVGRRRSGEAVLRIKSGRSGLGRLLEHNWRGNSRSKPAPALASCV